MDRDIRMKQQIHAPFSLPDSLVRSMEFVQRVILPLVILGYCIRQKLIGDNRFPNDILGFIIAMVIIGLGLALYSFVYRRTNTGLMEVFIDDGSFGYHLQSPIPPKELVSRDTVTFKVKVKQL
jgi:hypothetical protein